MGTWPRYWVGVTGTQVTMMFRCSERWLPPPWEELTVPSLGGSLSSGLQPRTQEEEGHTEQAPPHPPRGPRGRPVARFLCPLTLTWDCCQEKMLSLPSSRFSGVSGRPTMGLQATYSHFPTFSAVLLEALSCFSHLMLQTVSRCG